MGYGRTELLTNGEHDSLWRDGAKSLPKISKALEVANAIAIAKELYELSGKDEIDQASYRATLENLLITSGYQN